MDKEELNNLTHKIIGGAIDVHDALGPGLLESSYHQALLHELRLRGLHADSEVGIPCVYKGIKIDTSFRADIIVENTIIIELKATEKETSLYSKQLLTYLKLSGLPVGLLINFNRERLIDGLHRIVNNL